MIITKEVDRNRILAAELLVMGLVRRPEERKLLGEGLGEPDFIEPTDGHLFDVNTNSTEEVAKVVLEELKTRDLTKRVTNTLAVTREEVEFSEYNVHAKAEWLATQRAHILANNHNLIFWISAEDGAMGLDPEVAKEKGFVYGDGRFNIYFKSMKDGNVALSGKHIPLGINSFESLELGKRLLSFGGETLGPVETVDDLRVQPVGFKLENMETWISECRKMIPEFEPFWKLIENGDDLKQEKVMVHEVEEAKKVANGNNVVFQLEMERRGFEINKEGNHGVGYLGKQNNGIRNFKIEMIGGKLYTEPQLDSQGNLICPVCGAKVSSTESVCSRCGIGFKAKQN